MASSNAPIVVANAKINLGLEVLGRRDDGFHEIVTIFQEIGLSDRLSFRSSRDVTFESEQLAIAPESNLILQAARGLQRAMATDRGAEIRLEKSIPIGGGLGGGSSDAAATLRGLSRLWSLHPSDETFLTVARNLGSDVPFFLRGGTQLARGRGDELFRLPTPKGWVVVVHVHDSIPNKTCALYASLRPKDFSGGERVRAVAARLQHDGELRVSDLVNAFERPALELFGGTRRAFEAVRSAGAIPLLAGAGPTVLSVQPNELSARIIADDLRRAGFSVSLAPMVPALPGDFPEESRLRNGRRVCFTEGA